MIIASVRPRLRARRLLLLGQLGGQHRDEDDVVDAEDDLQDEERQEDRDVLGGEGDAEVHTAMLWGDGCLGPARRRVIGRGPP